jgi:hypothetical protein
MIRTAGPSRISPIGSWDSPCGDQQRAPRRGGRQWRVITMPRGPLTRAPPTPLSGQKHKAHPATAWIWRSLQAASRDASCRRRALGCSPALPGGRSDLEGLYVSLPAVVASTRVVISARLSVPVVPGRRHVSAGRQLAPNPSGHGGAAQPLRLPPSCTGSAGWRPAGRGAQRHTRPQRQRTPAAGLVGLPGPPPGAGEPGAAGPP